MLFCDIPFECCSFTKKFLHLNSDWVDLYSIRYIVESVFAQLLSEFQLHTFFFVRIAIVGVVWHNELML